MTRDQVLVELQRVFDDVFIEEVTVTPELSAADVSEWTSLTHVSLIIGIEDRFKIQFRVGEIEATQKVGDLADLIVRHKQSKQN